MCNLSKSLIWSWKKAHFEFEIEFLVTSSKGRLLQPYQHHQLSKQLLLCQNSIMHSVDICFGYFFVPNQTHQLITYNYTQTSLTHHLLSLSIVQKFASCPSHWSVISCLCYQKQHFLRIDQTKFWLLEFLANHHHCHHIHLTQTSQNHHNLSLPTLHQVSKS